MGKIIWTLFILFIGLSTGLQAQDSLRTESKEYTDAVGIRIGGTSGVTYKHKFSRVNAMELILATYPYAYGVTGLYERLVPTTAEGVTVYFGGGGHVSQPVFSRFLSTATTDEGYYRTSTGSNGVIVGIDGILGLEYKIRNVPVAISGDMKPYAEFYKWRGPFIRLDPGFSLRFTF